MALTLSRIKSSLFPRPEELSPETQLAKALSEFDVDLSAEQRTAMRINRSHPLAVDAVMQLTAEIDSILASQGCRKAFGPRMTTFLETLHQFAGIGDIMIGSAQGVVPGLIARSTWSVIRWSLLAISKYSPYIDKLSELFMKLGQSLPQLQQFADLYPRSQNLQDRLFEYYVPVVQLCHEILKLSKMSSFAQMFANITQTLDKFNHTLLLRAEALKNEANIQTAKLIQKEAKENARSRELTKRTIEQNKVDAKRKSRSVVLQACSNYRYQTVWKQTKKAGPTTIFREARGFKEWKQSQLASTLIYTGKLGCGKSVLLANMVNELYLEKRKEVIVTYFFCRFDDAESLKCRTVLGCLARQLLERFSDLDFIKSYLDSLNSYSDHDSIDLDTEDLLCLIRRSIFDPVYFVLDGLDDCLESERADIIKHLQRLQRDVPLLLCVSTRGERQELRRYEACQNITLYHEKIPEKNPDIEAYIDAEIGDRMTAGTLLIEGEDFVADVKQKLLEGSDGMFLWVCLQIASLSTMESNYEIREALKDLPKGLPETYARLLENSSRSNLRHPLLELIMAATRPLDVEELREALSVRLGDLVYDPEKVINSLDPVIKSCGGLVIVSEEESMVHFVHHSASQFLTTRSAISIEEEAAHSYMAGIIATYLNYSVFETQIARQDKIIFPVEALPSAILKNRLPLLGRFSQARASNNANLVKQFRSVQVSKKTLHFPFEKYAKSYFFQHLASSELSPALKDLLNLVISKKRIDPKDSFEDRGPVQLAVLAENEALVRLLLGYPMSEKHLRQGLSLAVAIGHRGIIAMLLPFCTRPVFVIREAIESDNFDLLEFLLEQDSIDPNEPTEGNQKTPIEVALSHGTTQQDLTALRILVANPRVNHWIYSGRLDHPVVLALRKLDREALLLLLQNPLMTQLPYDREHVWRAILLYIDHASQMDLIRMLLNAKVIGVEDSYRDLPIVIAVVMYVSVSAKLEVLTLLFELGANNVNPINELRVWNYDSNTAYIEWMAIEPSRRTKLVSLTAVIHDLTPDVVELLRKHGINRVEWFTKQYIP